jgi:nickel-dependent lactate racemase
MKHIVVSETQLRTGAWYDEQPIDLHFPVEWEVSIFKPRTPPALTDNEIGETLERPFGQPPLRERCRGKGRPLIIVDDPNRPTPAARVIPRLLKQIEDAGIPPKEIRILVATGTHGTPRIETIQKKVGRQATCSCQIFVHDPHRDCLRIGRTSFGTPVSVNRIVLSSDIVVGVGGIYPNHTAGWGGGSKLALGVLGFESIRHLHYRHNGVGWGASRNSNSFRQDLDEIARMIGLTTMVSLHVNADRDPIRITCGNHFEYFGKEVGFAKEVFSAPIPENADLIISNTYPNDLSLTFAAMKGITPLLHSPPAASRVAIAACREGVGYHGLFPLVDRPRFNRERHVLRRMSAMRPREFVQKAVSRLFLKTRATLTSSRDPECTRQKPTHPVWLYRPGVHAEPLPSQIPGMRVVCDWSEVLEQVKREQGDKNHIRVLIYPCAPLQCLAKRQAPPWVDDLED